MNGATSAAVNYRPIVAYPLFIQTRRPTYRPSLQYCHFTAALYRKEDTIDPKMYADVFYILQYKFSVFRKADYFRFSVFHIITSLNSYVSFQSVSVAS